LWVVHLEIADESFVFVMRADPKPKITAIVESCQRANT